MELTVSRVYGQALYDAAVEMEKVDEIQQETEQIHIIFQREKEFYEILTDPSLSVARKKELIKNVFEGRVSKETESFLYILVDKGRLHNYGDILKEFDKLKNEAEGFGEGVIYSARLLNEEQLQKLEAETGKLLGKKIRLKNLIDESLIGGVKIITEGKIIDASIRNRLDRLYTEIKDI
ncbi:MAG: ATP synthase F1 subunit delta [Eubacteriaceae bacterium]|nr:ATP synthase F1 subunit delta [Eubacteriaceae bacterium]